MPSFPTITKADGLQETFDPAKFDDSLRRSGSSQKTRDEVLSRVLESMKEGETTRDIYRRAYKILRSVDERGALKYSLRAAIADLGPSGYPFEDFIAEMFRSLGYRTQTRQILQGACISHEVDVVLEKEGVIGYVEAKFHNEHGMRSDIKTALYIKARADDVFAALPPSAKKEHTWWLVTNTKFTSQAIAFGTCAGLTMVSWDYPAEDNLQKMIERAEVHPVTALTTLSKNHKRLLLEEGIVLARTLKERPEVLRLLTLPSAAEAKVKKELALLFEG